FLELLRLPVQPIHMPGHDPVGLALVDGGQQVPVLRSALAAVLARADVVVDVGSGGELPALPVGQGEAVLELTLHSRPVLAVLADSGVDRGLHVREYRAFLKPSTCRWRWRSHVRWPAGRRPKVPPSSASWRSPAGRRRSRV